MSISSLFSDAVGMWRPRTTNDVATSNVDAEFPDVSAAPPDSRRLIRDRRYCHVLRNCDDLEFDSVSRDLAWAALEHEMAFVPGGTVCLVSDTVVASDYRLEIVPDRQELITVESIYLDRNCVTNADFLRFVQANGYGDPQNWPEQVLAYVVQFVDQTGQPGPKYWSDSMPPSDKLDHPVVGISWYEANAYANWSGKYLPSTEQWQRAGTWPHAASAIGDSLGGSTECQYPWGNAFDPNRANLWASGSGGTIAVNALSDGNTPNGVRQLIGNVWEWVDTQFLPDTTEDASILLGDSMAEIRGAAFDTYFHSQATCQFRTGQPLLHRGNNVGFRCCIRADELPSSLNTLSSSEDQI